MGQIAGQWRNMGEYQKALQQFEKVLGNKNYAYEIFLLLRPKAFLGTAFSLFGS
jgi:hypothetical protein